MRVSFSASCTTDEYGDPFDPLTTASPLINARQLDRVLGYVARGQEEGARLFIVTVNFDLATFDERFRDFSDALAEGGE